MKSRKTFKRHKVDKDGNIVSEKYSEKVWFLGIRISNDEHDYECDVDTQKNSMGFSGNRSKNT